MTRNSQPRHFSFWIIPFRFRLSAPFEFPDQRNPAAWAALQKKAKRWTHPTPYSQSESQLKDFPRVGNVLILEAKLELEN